LLPDGLDLSVLISLERQALPQWQLDWQSGLESFEASLAGCQSIEGW
jgi:hypothetical protein